MLLKTILALAYTIALPGYGVFVNEAQAGVLHDPIVVVAKLDGDLMVDLDERLRLSAEGLYGDHFRNLASDTESLSVGWATLGRELRRHGNICQWTEYPLFSWCTSYGRKHVASRNKAS